MHAVSKAAVAGSRQCGPQFQMRRSSCQSDRRYFSRQPTFQVRSIRDPHSWNVASPCDAIAVNA